MYKQDFVEKVATVARVSKGVAETCVNAVFETVTNALKKGEKVVFVGFGAFSVRKRAARNGVNPKTGAKIKIPAKKCVRFVAGKKLKEVVDKGK